MKRHRSLYPLSRDHHQALVQARNLRLAAEANDPDGLRQAAKGFAVFWKSDLQAHFWQEEQFVLPLLAKRHSREGDEVEETLRQHAEIALLVAGLSDKLARCEALEANLLAEIGESLRRHIRFEESELFPTIEASASEEELSQMNEQLEKVRSHAGQSGCALCQASALAIDH